jgi:2-keto-4-pentenoate hydratase/2-oxohepta-3-ene-1,7-dioic acid hydratase in catechol pathway
MKLCTFAHDGVKQAGLIVGDQVLSVEQVNVKRGSRFPTDLFELIRSEQVEALGALSQAVEPDLPLSEVRLTLPYERPGKVWCIGLNYLSHAEDLNEVQPEEPGSFMKPSSSFFEPGGPIELPPERLTRDVDAEGELAIVFGKRCREVPIEEIEDVILGYTTTLDLTALDVLARNTRYLQRSKSFDTFFSFGPVIVTRDEVKDVAALEVVTKQNGEVFSRDFVRNMRHSPFKLAAFHSDVMTFEPGDILSTGCPKGARIRPGDTVEAFIEGVGSLSAEVARRPVGRL